MARRIDTDKTPVTWVPDEGCYRTVEQKVKTGKVGGVEISVEVAELGDRVVWVDEAPGDVKDGSGHFEAFNGDDKDYRPTVPARS